MGNQGYSGECALWVPEADLLGKEGEERHPAVIRHCWTCERASAAMGRRFINRTAGCGRPAVSSLMVSDRWEQPDGGRGCPSELLLVGSGGPQADARLLRSTADAAALPPRYRKCCADGAAACVAMAAEAPVMLGTNSASAQSSWHPRSDLSAPVRTRPVLDARPAAVLGTPYLLPPTTA